MNESLVLSLSALKLVKLIQNLALEKTNKIKIQIYRNYFNYKTTIQVICY
jgi:hypothetical protein